MRSYNVFLALSLTVGAIGCQSEVDRQPAAVVTETSAPAAGSTPPTGTQPPPGAVTTNVVREKSSIDFIGAKVTRDHNGTFRDFSGWLAYEGSRPVAVAFDINLDSIETDEAKLTQHLKTADFFDVARYPKATFVSTSVAEAPPGSPEGATHIVRGILDLHGVQKEVTIPVTAQVTPEGVRTQSQFTINRHDWGISYRGMADDLIRDNVLIRLNLLFPPPPAA